MRLLCAAAMLLSFAAVTSVAFFALVGSVAPFGRLLDRRLVWMVWRQGWKC